MNTETFCYRGLRSQGWVGVGELTAQTALVIGCITQIQNNRLRPENQKGQTVKHSVNKCPFIDSIICSCGQNPVAFIHLFFPYLPLPLQQREHFVCQSDTNGFRYIHLIDKVHNVLSYPIRKLLIRHSMGHLFRLSYFIRSCSFISRLRELFISDLLSDFVSRNGIRCRAEINNDTNYAVYWVHPYFAEPSCIIRAAELIISAISELAFPPIYCLSGLLQPLSDNFIMKCFQCLRPECGIKRSTEDCLRMSFN